MAFLIIISGIIFISLLTTGIMIKTRRMTCPFIYKASSGQFYSIATFITTNPLNVDMTRVKQIEILNKHNVPKPLQMMADPFVIKEKGDFYVFYEELTQKKYAKGADIAVLHSRDGVQWNRLGIALREPFHLSFPNVFLYHGVYYMLPEAAACGEMRIYKAVEFPMKWEKNSVILAGKSYSDPMVYIKDEYIYVWYHTYLDGDDLRLIYAKGINGPWKEHPASPIRTNGNDSRPAGTINIIDNQMYYFVQNHSEGYGTGVTAYKINKLSPLEYEDECLKDNPLLWKNGDSWARDGMHQYSMVKFNNEEWLCVMDGSRNITQSAWKWNWCNWPIMYI